MQYRVLLSLAAAAACSSKQEATVVGLDVRTYSNPDRKADLAGPIPRLGERLHTKRNVSDPEGWLRVERDGQRVYVEARHLRDRLAPRAAYARRSAVLRMLTAGGVETAKPVLIGERFEVVDLSQPETHIGLVADGTLTFTAARGDFTDSPPAADAVEQDLLEFLQNGSPEIEVARLEEQAKRFASNRPQLTTLIAVLGRLRAGVTSEYWFSLGATGAGGVNAANSLAFLQAPLVWLKASADAGAPNLALLRINAPLKVAEVGPAWTRVVLLAPEEPARAVPSASMRAVEPVKRVESWAAGVGDAKMPPFSFELAGKDAVSGWVRSDLLGSTRLTPSALRAALQDVRKRRVPELEVPLLARLAFVSPFDRQVADELFRSAWRAKAVEATAAALGLRQGWGGPWGWGTPPRLDDRDTALVQAVTVDACRAPLEYAEIVDARSVDLLDGQCSLDRWRLPGVGASPLRESIAAEPKDGQAEGTSVATFMDIPPTTAPARKSGAYEEAQRLRVRIQDKSGHYGAAAPVNIGSISDVTFEAPDCSPSFETDLRASFRLPPMGPFEVIELWVDFSDEGFVFLGDPEDTMRPWFDNKIVSRSEVQCWLCPGDTTPSVLEFFGSIGVPDDESSCEGT